MPSPQQPDPQRRRISAALQKPAEKRGFTPQTHATERRPSHASPLYAPCSQCSGKHRVANAVVEGSRELVNIVEKLGGDPPVDPDLLSRDLKATVLAGDLRSFAIQAHTDAVLAQWAVMVRDKGYVLLVPQLAPSSELLREALWRVVMYRRHVIPAVDDKVLNCAQLGDEGDPFRRWKPASPLEDSKRKSGVVAHLPYKKRPGAVYGEGHKPEQPVKLELLLADVRSYAHCRCTVAHPPAAGQKNETECAHLERDERITYVPMLRLPYRGNGARIPVAFMVSRSVPRSRPHPSGVGLTPM